MRNTLKKLLAIILTVMVLFSCSSAAFAGGEGLYVDKATPVKIDNYYNNGYDFIYIYTSPDCINSSEVLKYFKGWVEIGNVSFYEVSSEDGYPSTMYKDIGGSVTMPVVVFVKDGKAEYYQGTATRAEMETALLEYCDIDASVPTSISFPKSEYTIKVGESVDIPITISPYGSYDGYFVHTDYNYKAINLNSGGEGIIRVKGLKVDSSTLVFETTLGGKTANVKINVVEGTATTYTLTYNGNGGSSVPPPQTGATSYTISSTKPTRSGYTFLGWSKSSSATSASYVAGNTITLSANTTLYAVWQKNSTGTKPTAPVVSISSTSVADGNSVTLTWTAVSNVTNYWVTGFKGEERVMGEIDNSRSKTLKLEAGTYDFSVVAINSYGETTGNWVRFTVYDSAPKAPVLKVSNDLIKKGENVTLSWNAVNNVTNYWIQGYKDGKTFVAEIDNSKSRTMILDVGYYEFVVKAINELGETNSNWVNFTVYDPQETTYTLTYNANGGSGAPSSQSGSSTYTVSYTTPTRSGYTFLGWSTSSSSSYATYDAGDTITLTSNTTLYAIWEQNYNSGSKSKCGKCGATFYDDEALEAHLANCDGYFNNNNISVTIRNNPGTRTLNYGDTVRIYADAQNLPAGAKIGWYVDDGSTISAKVSDDGTYCDITATGNGTVTLAAKAIDANGNVMTDSNGYQIADVQKINTKTSLWLRIVSFFKNLFGMNRTTVQLFKNLF